MSLIKKIANSKFGRMTLVLGMFGAGLWGCCKDNYHSHTYRVPIDQIFKTHEDNYEISYLDSEKKLNSMEFCRDTEVFKDLPFERESYAEVTGFCIHPFKKNCYIAKIHLANEPNLSPKIKIK